MEVMVSGTGRVHAVRAKLTLPHPGEWFETYCGKRMSGWQPAPGERLAVSCGRCEAVMLDG